MEIDLNEISDGRFYEANDMVKVGCDDCKGCSSCCRGMGDSIVLDPMDIFRLTTGLSCTFQQLLDTCVCLHVEEGMVLPHMKMAGKEECCAFLNEEGRCGIHPIRPGICRLFPLGRCYEDGTLRYFLQTGECKKERRTKMKIKKWLEIPDLSNYEAYLCQWHDFRKALQRILSDLRQEQMVRQVNLYLLKLFFQDPYDGSRDFYPQFGQRLAQAKRYVGIAG